MPHFSWNPIIALELPYVPTINDCIEVNLATKQATVLCPLILARGSILS